MASITITDILKDENGEFPTSGTITFVLSGWMVNSAGRIIVPGPGESAAVSSVDGTFSVVLESTTDATASTARTYAATFTGVLDGATVSLSLGTFQLNPTPTSQDLSDLLLAGAAAGTAANYTTLTLDHTEPRIKLNESDQASNEKLWDVDVASKILTLRTRTDADGAGVDILKVTRGTGTAVTSTELQGTAVKVGNTSASAITVGNSNSTLGFYAATPAAKPSAYTQTYATADKTHANPTAVALTDNGGGTADGTVAAQAAPVTLTDSTGFSGGHDDTLAATATPTTLTDSTGLSGTHDDTLAATTVPADITGGEAPTEAEHNAHLAVSRVMAQNISDVGQKVIELVTLVAVLAQNQSDLAQKVIELVTLAGTAQNNLKECTSQINALIADHADTKQLVNSVIDDLQTLGLVS